MKNTQVQLIKTMEDLAQAANKLGESIRKTPWPKPSIKKALI